MHVWSLDRLIDHQLCLFTCNDFQPRFDLRRENGIECCLRTAIASKDDCVCFLLLVVTFQKRQPHASASPFHSWRVQKAHKAHDERVEKLIGCIADPLDSFYFALQRVEIKLDYYYEMLRPHTAGEHTANIVTLLYIYIQLYPNPYSIHAYLRADVIFAYFLENLLLNLFCFVLVDSEREKETEEKNVT